jgi:hypothetical protein
MKESKDLIRVVIMRMERKGCRDWRENPRNLAGCER